MKKVFCGFVLLVSCLLMVSGCGSSGGETTTTTTTVATTTITLATTTTTETTTTTTTTLPAVSGTITYPGWSDAPLAGVLVSLESVTQTTTTDASGHFIFTNVAAGSHTISFYRQGWTLYPATETFNVTTSNVTKNATAELAGWAVDSSGTTENLFGIADWKEGGIVAGGENSTILWRTTVESWSVKAAAGLPAGQRVVQNLMMAANSPLAFIGSVIYSSSDQGATFVSFVDLSTGKATLQVKRLAVTNDAWYVLDSSDDTLLETEDNGLSYTNIALPAGGITFNSIVAEQESADAFIIGVADDGGIYLAITSDPTVLSWTKIDSPTSDNFVDIRSNGITNSGITGSTECYLITDRGGLYLLTGNVYTGAGTFAVAKVFEGFPGTLNGVDQPENDLTQGTFIVGDDGLILRQRAN